MKASETWNILPRGGYWSLLFFRHQWMPCWKGWPDLEMALASFWRSKQRRSRFRHISKQFATKDLEQEMMLLDVGEALKCQRCKLWPPDCQSERWRNFGERGRTNCQRGWDFSAGSGCGQPTVDWTWTSKSTAWHLCRTPLPDPDYSRCSLAFGPHQEEETPVVRPDCQQSIELLQPMQVWDQYFHRCVHRCLLTLTKRPQVEKLCPEVADRWRRSLRQVQGLILIPVDFETKVGYLETWQFQDISLKCCSLAEKWTKSGYHQISRWNLNIFECFVWDTQSIESDGR